MTKTLLITDLHHGFSNSEFHTNYQLDFLESLNGLIKEKGIERIVNLGDTHDKRMTASFLVIERFKEAHAKLASNVKEYVAIAGNHDCYYTTTNEITSLPSFFQSENQRLVTNEPLKIGNLCFIPWISEGNVEVIMKFVRENNKKGNYLFGHLEQAGFSFGGTISKKNNLFLSDYNNYTKIFTGHYHERQEKDNLLYLGNPYQKDFGELTKKYIHILDDETCEIETIENTKNIYEKFVINGNDTPETIKDKCSEIKGKIVKIFIDSSDTNFINECEKIITDSEPHRREILSKNVEIEMVDGEETQIDIFNKSDDEINSEFLEQIEYITPEQKNEFVDLFDVYWKRSIL